MHASTSGPGEQLLAELWEEFGGVGGGPEGGGPEGGGPEGGGPDGGGPDGGGPEGGKIMGGGPEGGGPDGGGPDGGGLGHAFGQAEQPPAEELVLIVHGLQAQ